MIEKEFEQTIKAEFKRDYPHCFYKKICEKFSKGFPDALIILNGKISFIEYKISNHKNLTYKNVIGLFSKLQLNVMKQIDKAGGSVYAMIYHNPSKTRYYYFLEHPKKLFVDRTHSIELLD